MEAHFGGREVVGGGFLWRVFMMVVRRVVNGALRRIFGENYKRDRGRLNLSFLTPYKC